jgi:hypothetical protein
VLDIHFSPLANAGMACRWRLHPHPVLQILMQSDVTAHIVSETGIVLDCMGGCVKQHMTPDRQSDLTVSRSVSP